jgi:hypothetical protein
MKTNIIKLTLAFGLFISSAAAQAQIDLGVKGGLSLADLNSGFSNSNAVNSGYKWNAGPGGVLYGEYHLTDAWSFMLGVGYAYQGGKRTGMQAYNVPSGVNTSGNYVYASMDSRTTLSYLTIPLLAKYSYGFGKGFAVYIDAGPYVSFLMAARQKNTGNGMLYADVRGTQPLTGEANPLLGNNVDVKGQYETFNFGAEADLGVKYHITDRHSVFVEVGGNYGFLNIEQNSAGGDMRTSALTANVGYAFQLFQLNAKTPANKID